MMKPALKARFNAPAYRQSHTDWRRNEWRFQRCRFSRILAAASCFMNAAPLALNSYATERSIHLDEKLSASSSEGMRSEVIDDLRRFDVHTDRAHWDKVKAGDQIKVSYRQGKYTGTVWSAEID